MGRKDSTALDCRGDGKVTKLCTREGNQTKYAFDGDVVYAHYTGKIVEENKVFDTTRNRDIEFSFKVGSEQTIDGLELAVKRMSEGERATIVVHPDCAFGYGGNPQGFHGKGEPIPANATLEFDFELISIEAEERPYDWARLKAEKAIEDIKTLKDEGTKFYGDKRIVRAFLKYDRGNDIADVALKHSSTTEEQKEELRRLKVMVMNNSVLCFLSRNEFKDAKETSQEVLGLEPNNSKAHFRLAKALVGLREFDEAVSHLKKAQKLNPSDRAIREELKRVSEERGVETVKEKKIYGEMFTKLRDVKKSGLYEGEGPSLAKKVENTAVPALSAEVSRDKEKNKIMIDRTKIPQIDVTPAQDKGVVKQILRAGTAGRPKSNANMCIHFIGRIFEKGKQPYVFYSTRDNNEPVYFQLGKEQIIPAIEYTVRSMRFQELAIVSVRKSKYGWGKAGLPEGFGNKGTPVPPRAKFELELEMVWCDACEEEDNPMANLSFEERMHKCTERKEYGNRQFKKKEYADARVAYEEAARYFSGFQATDGKQKAEEASILAALMSNTAQCHIMMQEFRESINACRRGLQHEPSNVKLLYRLSRGLIEAGEYDEAAERIEEALKTSPEDTDLKTLKVKVEKKKSEVAASEKNFYQKMMKRMKKKNDELGEEEAPYGSVGEGSSSSAPTKPQTAWAAPEGSSSDDDDTPKGFKKCTICGQTVEEVQWARHVIKMHSEGTEFARPKTNDIDSSLINDLMAQMKM